MLYRTLYPLYRRSRYATHRRRFRFEMIERTLCLQGGQRVLEIGCANGIDFMQFAATKYHATGIDVADVERVCEFEFRQLDARSLPWADQHFDAVVSIGVLEHIQPLDVLCQVTLEIRRVAKRFCVIVPSTATWIEPHTWSPFWQLRDRNRKACSSWALNYFSDEAWLQFPGFLGATSHRYWHVPGVQNLVIHGN